MTDFLSALALVLVIEGLLYAVLPGQMLKMLEQLRFVPAAALRAAGIFFAALGVLLLYLVKAAAG